MALITRATSLPLRDRNQIHWSTTAGGPFILLPERAIKLWGGVFRSWLENKKTDYDRACEICRHSGLGIIHVGGTEAIVFGEHAQTACISTDDKNEVFLIEWIWADDNESIAFHINNIAYSSDIFRELGSIFQVTEPIMYLFDSALDGNFVTDAKSERQVEALKVELNPGTYQIQTGSFKPDKHTFFMVRRLMKRGSSRNQIPTY